MRWVAGGEMKEMTGNGVAVRTRCGGSLRWMWQQQKWRMKKKNSLEKLSRVDPQPEKRKNIIPSIRRSLWRHRSTIIKIFVLRLLREERRKNKGDGRRDQSKSSSANLWLCVLPFEWVLGVRPFYKQPTFAGEEKLSVLLGKSRSLCWRFCWKIERVRERD